MKKYKGNGFSDKRAQIIGEFIEKNFGSLGHVNPHQLLELARPKKSPIHKFFEWDDKKAAENYRVWQARFFLCNISIEIAGDDVRAFHNLNIGEEDGRTYYTLDKARSNEDLWDQIINSALDEADYWNKKYKSYKALRPIHVSIEKTIKKLRR